MAPLTLRSVPSLALILALPLMGCRRDAPEPSGASGASAATGTAAASAATSGPRCPAIPDWAPPDDPDHLLAELLYQVVDASAGRKGTGMRIYDTGLVTAYDEVEASVVDGKVKTIPIPGRWRPKPGRASAARLAELTALIASVPPADITDIQGRDRTGNKKPTFVSVRLGGKLTVSCFRSSEGSGAQQKIESLIREIMGEANDDKAKPAPSASAAPKKK